jgi:hypothetical protein
MWIIVEIGSKCADFWRIFAIGAGTFPARISPHRPRWTATTSICSATVIGRIVYSGAVVEVGQPLEWRGARPSFQWSRGR